MKPVSYGTRPLARNKCISSTVNGQSLPVKLIAAVIAIVAMCAGRMRGKRRDIGPPVMRNPTNAKCVKATRRAATSSTTSI